MYILEIIPKETKWVELMQWLSVPMATLGSPTCCEPMLMMRDKPPSSTAFFYICIADAEADIRMYPRLQSPWIYTLLIWTFFAVLRVSAPRTSLLLRPQSFRNCRVRIGPWNPWKPLHLKVSLSRPCKPLNFDLPFKNPEFLGYYWWTLTKTFTMFHHLVHV